jgi:hypothetical protein
MANTFGFGTDTTGFSSTVHDHILKEVVATLRGGLVSLPKGAVVPATIVSQQGENFTLRSTAYPDLVDTGATDPLTEGVAPSALKLGIDTQDWTVTQSGARTVVTDIAQLQSPHDLKTVAADKIARLAADKIDGIGRTALAALSSTNDFGAALDTSILLDMKAAAQSANFEAIPGAGFYLIGHPNAFRGLEGEDNLNGFVDVMSDLGNSNVLTKGASWQYRGFTALPSSKFVADGSGNYPVYVVPANSIAAGDLGSIEFVHWSAPGVGNELGQLMGIGFKGILGAAVLNFAEVTDGTGTNGSTVPRVLKFTVTSGVSNQ